MIAVLFARSDSDYKNYPEFDVYDIDRDARSFCKKIPVLAHPPCRAWGQLSHMANPREGEKQLAYFALAQVRLNGGVLEHPASSRFFKEANLPTGMFTDEFGGFTIEIDQFDFGHVAHKATRLYIKGVDYLLLPKLPNRNLNSTDRSICGNVKGTKRCTQYQREYTPPHAYPMAKGINFNDGENKMSAFKQKIIKLLAESQKIHALAMLQNTPVGVNLEVVLREVTKKRNNDQNALMWSVLGEIADQVWVDKRQFSADMWNVYFKNLYLPDEANEPYLHELVTKPESYRKWAFLPDGTRQLIGSTTDLTTYGMSQHMEAIYAFSSEKGVMFTFHELAA